MLEPENNQMQLIQYTKPIEKEEKKVLNNQIKKRSTLEVTPADKIVFPYGSEQEKSKATITLRNVSKQSLGFKIRGNNVEAYKVRPFTGFLEPGGTVNITAELIDGQPCLPKDKLLVQWVPVENKVIKVQSFNVLWKAAPKTMKEEHVLQCCKAAKAAPVKKVHEEKLSAQAPTHSTHIDRKTTQKLSDLERSVRGLQVQNTVLRLSLFLLALGLLPVAWLLYEVVDLLRLQPGGLCDRTIRDSLLASLLCRPDRTILPAHMM